MFKIFALLLSIVSAQAAYQSTEILAVTLLKTNGTTDGVRVLCRINDSSYEIPPVALRIIGAEYQTIKGLSGAARKNAIWAALRPQLKEYYREQIAAQSAPAVTEIEDQANPIIGVLSTTAP